MTAEAPLARLQPVADGLYRFDTGYIRPRHTACFVVTDRDRAAIVDCGVANNVESLLSAIDALEVPRTSIDALVITHAHLDHAGGAGQLMTLLPAARLFAHPSAARHMIDPSRLEQGVRSVYGDEFFDREYGELRPVPADRVIETPDGHEWTLAGSGRELRILHTPGHAWHHQSIFDPASSTVIAGDAFGVGYPELDGADGRFFVPVTPPNQFDPDTMHASIDRIVDLAPTRVEPTHFGTVEDPETIAAALHSMIDAYIECCVRARSIEELEAGIRALYADALMQRGRPERDIEAMRETYALDADLVAQGLWHWRTRRERVT